MNSVQIRETHIKTHTITVGPIGQDFALMPELNLIMACQRSDKGAFEELLKRHERSIRNILYRLAPDLNDTSDIIQDASIRIWRSIRSLRDPRRFRAWLKRIVTNLYYDRLRTFPRDFWIVSLDETSVYYDDNSQSTTKSVRDLAPQPDEKALSRELAEVLRKAMSKIPSQFKEALLLRDEHGMSYEEIAMRTKSNLGTVKSRISRGRLKVQREVAPYLDLSICAS